jgi:hypothetical protein
MGHPFCCFMAPDSRPGEYNPTVKLVRVIPAWCTPLISDLSVPATIQPMPNKLFIVSWFLSWRRYSACAVGYVQFDLFGPNSRVQAKVFLKQRLCRGFETRGKGGGIFGLDLRPAQGGYDRLLQYVFHEVFTTLTYWSQVNNCFTFVLECRRYLGLEQIL